MSMKRKTYTATEQAANISRMMYARGGGSKAKRMLYAKYIQLIRKLAHRGNKEAQFELAQFYEDINFLGVNPSYNPRKCIHWYTKACEKNHAEACNNLAYFFEHGIGVKKSLVRARQLYNKASQLGSKQGKTNYKLMLDKH